jgi:hypothetical protein
VKFISRFRPNRAFGLADIHSSANYRIRRLRRSRRTLDVVQLAEQPERVLVADGAAAEHRDVARSRSSLRRQSMP